MAIIDNNTIMSQPYRFEIDGVDIQSCPLSDSKELVVYIDQTDNFCKGIIVTNNNGMWTKTEPIELFNEEILVIKLVDITDKEETDSDLNFVVFGSLGYGTLLKYSYFNIDILSDSINLKNQQLIVDEVQEFCANSCRYGYATCLYQDREGLHIATFSATNGLNTAVIDFGETTIYTLYDSVFLKGDSVSSYQYIMFVYYGLYTDSSSGLESEGTFYSIIKYLPDLTDIIVLSQDINLYDETVAYCNLTYLSYKYNSNPNILLTWFYRDRIDGNVLFCLLGRGDGTSTDDITMNFSGGGMSLDVDTGVLTYDVTKINDDKAFISYSKEAECFSVCVTADNTVGLTKGITFGMGNLGASQFSISNLIPDNNTIVNYVADNSIQSVIFTEPIIRDKQYLDEAGLKQLAIKTKEYMEKRSPYIISNMTTDTDEGSITIEPISGGVIPEPTDELLGTWLFNPKITTTDLVADIKFTSNEREYFSLQVGVADMSYVEPPLDSPVPGLPPVAVNFIAYSFSDDKWDSEASRTITITDTSSLTNREEFTTWLKANAVKQTGGASN